MATESERIRRVLEAFDVQEWDEIHLVTDDAEVHLVARRGTHVLTETSHVGGVAPPQASAAPAAARPPTSDGHVAPAPVGAAEAGGDLGLVVVEAPTPGIFWRAPSPGAPPFVDVGSHVERDAQLCIVEVMKLMNTLPAPVVGTVVEVCAANGEQVESGRVLFRIRPDGS